MSQDALKQAAAKAAAALVPEGAIVGVGTGSTVNFFIDELATMKGRIEGAVSSSEASAQRLKAAGIAVFDLNSVRELPVYVDGADEITRHLMMIKGGGGALTREKIVAAVAQQFICIADASKLVDVLGKFPLPVEVIPMAVPQVMRRFAAMGGDAQLRAGVLTDNGHPIVDVRGLRITDPLAFEQEVNQWPGVVTVGVFARHRASVCLLGTARGVQVLEFASQATVV